jgi:hypothetical protein
VPASVADSPAEERTEIVPPVVRAFTVSRAATGTPGGTP